MLTRLTSTSLWTCASAISAGRVERFQKRYGKQEKMAEKRRASWL